MPEFSAALFATIQRPNSEEHSLLAHAILLEGSRPYWEVYVNEKMYRFISIPDFILEEGLWQLMHYCQHTEKEHPSQHINPMTLDQKFGADIYQKSLDNLHIDLKESGIEFKLIQWPGYWVNKWNEKIETLQKHGVSITHHQ
jgi:hypothetical protein